MDAIIDRFGLNAPEFDRAMQAIYRDEGAFASNSKDPGGITSFGISLRFLKASGIDIDMDGDIDEDDIRAIKKKDAREIYYKKFWKPYRLHELESEMIAVKVFDLGVNIGMKEAIKIIQRSVNDIHGFAKIKADGVMSQKTIDAINEMNPNTLIDAYRTAACAFYREIVKKNPVLEVFLKGWLRRAMQ